MNFQTDRWIHANCALWTHGITENPEGGLNKFPSAYQKYQNLDCDYCNSKGASVLCSKIKTCKKKFHFPCALKAKCLFLRDKTIICKNCYENTINPEISINNILKDFNTNRRLYIADANMPLEKENSKKNKQVILSPQEKYAHFQSGTFNRFGSLTVLNICKNLENNDSNKYFDEYLVLKKIFESENANSKSLLLFLIYQNKKQYYINSKCLTNEDFNLLFEPSKKRENLAGHNEKKPSLFDHFQKNEINHYLADFYQKSIKIEDVFSLWQILCEKSLLSLNSLPSDYIVDFISRFLGFNNIIIKKWSKASLDSFQIFKKNFSIRGFLPNFFLKGLDDQNPFVKQQLIENIHNEIITDSFFQIDSQENQSNLVNPKNLPLKTHSKIMMSKENKKNKLEGTSISDFNIKIDEIVNEQKFAIEPMHILPPKIQTEKELERKLKAEYSLYKKRTTKGVFVAPSNIHKYGLFATNK